MAKPAKPLNEREIAERAVQDSIFGEANPLADGQTVPTAEQLDTLRANAEKYRANLAARRAKLSKADRKANPPPKPNVFRYRVFFVAFMEATTRAAHVLWEKRLTTGKTREVTPEKAIAKAAKKAEQLAEIFAALKAQGAGEQAATLLKSLGLA